MLNKNYSRENNVENQRFNEKLISAFNNNPIPTIILVLIAGSGIGGFGNRALSIFGSEDAVSKEYVDLRIKEVTRDSEKMDKRLSRIEDKLDQIIYRFKR